MFIKVNQVKYFSSYLAQKIKYHIKNTSFMITEIQKAIRLRQTHFPIRNSMEIPLIIFRVMSWRQSLGLTSSP